MGIIGKQDLREIIKVAELLVNTASNLKGNPKPERKGGYFVLRDKQTADIVLIVPIGIIDPEKDRAYFTFAQEKGKRLYANLSLDHISSWQSRNEAEEKYGGAIIAGDFILSFSGLPELADEAVMLELAVSFNWIKVLYAKGIARISGNSLYNSLHNSIYYKEGH